MLPSMYTPFALAQHFRLGAWANSDLDFHTKLVRCGFDLLCLRVIVARRRSKLLPDCISFLVFTTKRPLNPF